MCFKSYSILLVAALYCLLVPSESYAQSSAMLAGVQDSITRQFNVNEVEVVANRRDLPIVPAQTLSGARLEGLSTQSVADAIRYFSGVQIKDYGGIGGIKTVDVRSMGSHHLGVFYDGVEIGNAQNGTVDLGKFSMENVESISLYSGQRAEILQTAKDYASANTLYLRTRRPRFTKGKSYHVTTTMKAGTFGLANPSVCYEQKLTEQIHLSVNGEFTYSTGRYHFRIHKLHPNGTVAWDTTGVRQNGDVMAGRAEVGIFGYLPDGKWHVKGYFYGSEKGIPRAIVRNVWTSSQRQWDRNIFVQADYEQELAKGYRLRVAAKYANDYMRYLNPDTTLMYLDNRFHQQEAYVSVDQSYRIFSWWDLALSIDYLFNHLNADMPAFVQPTRHTELVALATGMHYQWIRMQASVLGTFVQDRILRPNSSISSSAEDAYRFTPSVALSAQPMLSEEWFIRALYKHIFRMPTFNDLYYTDIGNISLKPEYTTQYDLGMEWSKRIKTNRQFSTQINLKADGYFNQVTNKIIAVPKGNSQYRWMMMNLGYVEILGVDVNAGVEWQIATGSKRADDVELGVQLCYTYQSALDRTDPADPITYGGQISYVPKHSGSVLGHIAWRGWGLHYSFIYVGERYHTSANIPANYEQPWYTHDLSLSKVFDLKVCRLTATAEINNMLNQQYDVVLNYPMPGINGKCILKLEF